MAKNLGGLNYPANFEQGGTNGTDPNTARDNLGVSTETLEKNANYTTNLADRGLVIRFVGAGGYTLGLAPVATLIDGWNVVVRNDSSTNLLIEPDGSEVIDGASNLILEVGQAIIIYSDDIEFFTLGQPAVPSGTGANTSLSNLSSVAINTSLISDTDVTDDLGSLAIRWRDIFAQSLSTGDTNADSLKIRGYDVDGATFVDFITITAGNTPTCVLHGTVTCTTQAPLTNNTTLASTAYVDSAVTAAAGAPTTATYLLQTANGSLPNAQAMGALSTGLVKNTTTTGIQTIAIAGTDYLAPAAIGVTVQGYDAGLAALAAFNTNGFVVQTANNVFAGRTATGTANEIDIANPDGVSGNPVWSLPNALTFTGKTITGGAYSGASATTFTFTTGTIGTAVIGVTQAPLTSNTTIATTQYVDLAVAAGGSGANVALSNLSSVAINTTLVSDADITDDLGTQAIRWRNIYGQTIQTGDTAADTLQLGAWDVDGAVFVPFITFTANNTPTGVIASAMTCTTQAPLDASNKVASTAYVDAAVTAGSGAPTGATYITQTPSAGLSAEQALSALSSGILKSTTGTGVVSIAAQGTDYYAPGGTDVAVSDGGTGVSSLTAYAVICGGTTSTNPVQSIASVGTSGQVLTSNGAGALPTFQTASGGAGDAVSKAITQSSHGFAVGDVIYHTGSAYAKASASAASSADVIGIVSVVADVNNFTVVTHGYISTLSGLTADTTYFLSTTAGALTATEPSTAGQVSKPVLQSISTTAGYLINYRGVVIGDITVGPVMISTQTVSGVANVDFTSGLNSTYTKYKIEMTNVVPGTDNVNLLLRGSTNGGSSYLSTNEYYAGMSSINSGATAANTTNNAGTAITLNGSNPLDNASGSSSCEVTLTLSNLSSSAFYKHMMWQTAQSVSATSAANTTGSGFIATTSPVNALRLLASLGNLSGTFTLWGIK